MLNINSILRCFPISIYQKFEQYFSRDDVNINQLEEIRVRVGRPIFLRMNRKDVIIDYIVQIEEILEILQHICDNSIYSYQGQICQGFITTKGGHRIGITGNVVMKDGKVSNITYISSLNFRIAKQIIGCSSKILQYIIAEENTVHNTLIVSPPGAGKTTILRDVARRISNGIEQIRFEGINVGIVDERGEIAAMYRGVPQNDIGIRTDVLDNVPKDVGMTMLIRSMSPQVIIADEIGNEKDIEAIQTAICSGVKGIFTAHGSNIEDIKRNSAMETLLKKHIFDKIIFLQKDFEIGKVYEYQKLDKQYICINSSK